MGTDDYDVVIRIRPDLKLLRFSVAEILTTGADPCVISGSYVLAPEYHGFSDQFAFGARDAMTAYCDIWPLVSAAGSGRYAPGFPEFLREEIFFYHLFAAGIDMRVAQANVADCICREPDIFEASVARELAEDLLAIHGESRSPRKLDESSLPGDTPEPA